MVTAGTGRVYSTWQQSMAKDAAQGEPGMDTPTLTDVIQQALDPDFAMGWDLFLALVPLALAVFLFRRGQSRGPVWWVSLALFVLFLPNAAYPLTDFLHFVLKVRQRPHLPAWAVALLVVPEYFVYIGASFLAYVLSLQFMGAYVRRIGKPRVVASLEALLHALSALGIYLGRVLRLNSWDALTHPVTVVGASAGAFDRAKTSLFVVGTCILVAAAYYAIRFLIDAVLNRRPISASQDELLGLLDRVGYEVGRDADGRLFLRRQGLDWPPRSARRTTHVEETGSLPHRSR
jgi:uncharacterized membrane protein